LFCFDTATTPVFYTLSLHDGSSDLLVLALNVKAGQEESAPQPGERHHPPGHERWSGERQDHTPERPEMAGAVDDGRFLDLTRNTDRKSTRLNSSHVSISYAVFCLKK